MNIHYLVTEVCYNRVPLLKEFDFAFFTDKRRCKISDNQMRLYIVCIFKVFWASFFIKKCVHTDVTQRVKLGKFGFWKLWSNVIKKRSRQDRSVHFFQAQYFLFRQLIT